MKTAKDVMTPSPKFVQSGEQLRDTIQLFLKSGIHSSPVITPNGEILGLLTEFGLVKAALRHFLDTDRQEKVVNHKDLLEEAICVYESDSLDDVVKAMMKSPTRRVLVVTQQKRLVGIISPKDLLRYLLGETESAYDMRLELEKAQEETKKLTTKVKSLQGALGKYQALINDSPYMTHSVDVSGRITIANKKMHETLRYAENELIGKTLNDLYPHTVVHEAFEGLKQIQEDGKQHSTYTSMMTKNGEKIRVEVASSALRDANGKFVSTITISREIDSEALLRALHGMGTEVEIKKKA